MNVRTSLHLFCEYCNTTAINAIQSFNTPLEYVTTKTSSSQTESTGFDARLHYKEDQLNKFTTSISKFSLLGDQSVTSPGILPAPTEADKCITEGAALKIVEYRDRERQKLNLIFHRAPEPV